MAKITKFTKDTDFKAIRAGFAAAVKDYGDSIGVKFEIGNIRFVDGEFTTKLTAKIEGAVSREESRENLYLKHNMELHNLQFDGVGGRKLVGYLPRCHRANFVFTDPNKPGKQFRCETYQAKEWFSKVA